MEVPHKMKTLAELMKKLSEDGFKEEFRVKEETGLLYGPDSEKSYAPEDVTILNFYRFEGISDPADNSILYAIETKDKTRGVLTDAYGPYADLRTTEFVRKVEEIAKKTDKEKQL